MRYRSCGKTLTATNSAVKVDCARRLRRLRSDTEGAARGSKDGGGGRDRYTAALNFGQRREPGPRTCVGWGRWHACERNPSTSSGGSRRRSSGLRGTALHQGSITSRCSSICAVTRAIQTRVTPAPAPRTQAQVYQLFRSTMITGLLVSADW